MRRLELAYKLSSWQGPARLLCFVRGMRVKLRLQTQNFGAVGRGGFVRIGGEGLDLVLAHGELYGLCGGLLGRGVRVCHICLGDRRCPLGRYSAQSTGSGCLGPRLSSSNVV